MSEDPLNIGDAINQYIKKTGKSAGFESAEVINAWPEVMGEAIANRTNTIYFRKGTLYVYFNSAPLKNEMLFSREKVVRNMNEYLGETVVMNIVIG
ncbi:MAG: DUF721 domain-containing protein [Bacteroidota bacterium]